MAADRLASIGYAEDGMDLIADWQIQIEQPLDLDAYRFVWLKPVRK